MENNKSEFTQVFELVCQKLPASGIRFLMIGGHAVNFYGYSRATLDVDFMIASTDTAAVREIMVDSGFTNVAEHENVIFFNHPGYPLRVDFLQIDSETMDTLSERAVTSSYAGHPMPIPSLKDLIAMKLFSMKSGNPQREDKDFPDIVHLVREHELDIESDLKPLCLQFGTKTIYEKLKMRISELGNA